MDLVEVYEVVVDLTEVESLLGSINDKLEILNPGIIQLNGYFYFLIFIILGVGGFVLLYKALKSFV